MQAVENPFQDALRYDRPAPPCIVVIFGANGDLTRRKLMPALYHLTLQRKLPADFAVVGVSRTAMSDDDFRENMRHAVREFSEDSHFEEQAWTSWAGGLYYLAGDVFDQTTYQRLEQRVNQIGKERMTGGNILFYLSTHPSQYERVSEGLHQAGLSGLSARDEGWRRLVVEKPFGRDTESARRLNNHLSRHFAEQEIYRIDHYLGKETVQNIIAFRFGNGMFEPLWNRRYVNHVQITAAESIGVEGRGAYYEQTGALRDMIQNHLLQVLATVAMEPPAAFEPEAVRDERAKVLRSLRPLRPEEALQYAVAGQYGPSTGAGGAVPGFRQEPGVDPQSQTETYAALTFFVENWRWAGVPFYVRTGKRLPKRVTDVAIQFQPAPLSLFRQPGVLSEQLPVRQWPNLLVLRIQPEEGISLRFLSKRPGPGMHLGPVTMDFNYGASFGAPLPSAYQTLLLDALRGDSTLYTRQDMVEASWAAVQPVLEAWAETPHAFPNYEAGSWGPREADEMLARYGHAWRIP